MYIEGRGRGFQDLARKSFIQLKFSHLLSQQRIMSYAEISEAA